MAAEHSSQEFIFELKMSAIRFYIRFAIEFIDF